MAYTDAEQTHINTVRSLLSMRQTDSAFASAARLSDEEIYVALGQGVNYVNAYPPVLATVYTVDTIPAGLTGPLYSVGMFWCLVQLGVFEVGKHFQYNDNGISLGRDKSGQYMTIAQSLLTSADVILSKMKLPMAMGEMRPAGQFSGTIAVPRSIIRGLRGTRQGSGN